MQCRNCRTFCDDEALFCSRCGLRFATLVAPVKDLLPQTFSTSSPRVRRLPGFRLLWPLLSALLIVIVVLLLVGSISLFLEQQRLKQGTGSGSTARPVPDTSLTWSYALQERGAGVKLWARGLPDAPAGHNYVGWLINPHRPDQLLMLAPLKAGPGGVLTFESASVPNFNPRRLNLYALFTQVEITLETASVVSRHPVGRIVLDGTLAEFAGPALLARLGAALTLQGRRGRP